MAKAMKKHEVPQDDSEKFEHKFDVLQYAIDEDGKYTAVRSVGWEPKNIVMEEAWEYEREKIDAARALVKEGKKSPLYYHMRKNLMTMAVLKGYSGFSWWRTFRHFKPSVFKKLKPKDLDKYLYAFGYKTYDELLNIDDK